MATSKDLRGENVELARIAQLVRAQILRFAATKTVHIGAALSVVDILVALYFYRLRIDPETLDWAERDWTILSKGHGTLALYAVLAERGYLPDDLCATFGEPGNELAGHPVEFVPGVEVATGALGHGLAIACGLALSMRLDQRPNRIVVVLGDGELDEGSVWESAMFAAHRSLASVVAIVDRNGVQQRGSTEDVLALEPLAEKWAAFGWDVQSADGHDFAELAGALDVAWASTERPNVILARTIKGKGVSFMEDNPTWHMGFLESEQLAQALSEVEA